MAQETMAVSGQLDESILFGEGTQSSLAEKAVRPSGGSGAAVGEMRKSSVAECEGQDDAYGPRPADPKVAAAAERLATRRAYLVSKRAFDVVFSLLVLVLLCWLYGFIAIVIKIDDPKGSVFFRQRRVGRGGKEFTMYKFRSMRPDAEQCLAELETLNEKTGPVFKMHDDPRVTRVGHFLRRTSLDELPQFVNVLKGDLSVVGPRPALPREVAEYSDRDRQRLFVKQGLTCFWQVQPNRDDIPFEEWIDLDLRYIRECSLWVDFKVIARTVLCVVAGRGH